MDRKEDAKDRVGNFTMEIAAAPEPEPIEEDRQQRVEALTAWLLAEWERQQKEAA